MKEVAVLFYEGTIGHVECYLDGQIIKTKENNLLYVPYGPAMKELLNRNGIVANHYTRICGPINDALYVDFGSYTYFVEIRFIDNIDFEEE